MRRFWEDYEVEVSHDDVVTTGIKKKMKSGHEIGRTGRVRLEVDGDIDGDLVDDGCYGEELGGVVIGEEEVGGVKGLHRWGEGS